MSCSENLTGVSLPDAIRACLKEDVYIIGKNYLDHTCALGGSSGFEAPDPILTGVGRINCLKGIIYDCDLTSLEFLKAR